MKTSNEIQKNRLKYLEILRSGFYKKGTIKSDEKGYPVIESKEDDDGHCACAIMIHEFPDSKGQESILIARRALKLTRKDCGYIQHEINDTDLSFVQIANRIEAEVFK